MTRYSVQSRDRIFVLSFDRNMSNNISKNSRSKYSQKVLNHDRQSATDAIKTASKRVI